MISSIVKCLLVLRYLIEGKVQNSALLKPLENSCVNSSLLKIGAPISFYSNDTYFTQGSNILNGWKLWAEWTNYESGGIDTVNGIYLVELLYIEDFSNTEYVKKATAYALATQHSDYIFAPYSTSLNDACLSLTEAVNVTLISAGTSVTPLYHSSEHLIGLLPAAYKYTQTAFKTFSEMGAKSIAVISDSNFPLCANETSAMYANAYNLSLYGHFNADTESENYSSTISQILSDLKDHNVDAVLGCSFESLCLQIPSSAKNLDYNPSGIMFVACSESVDVASHLGQDSAYTFGITPWAKTAAIHCKYTGWTAADFSDRYEQTYGIAPSFLAAAAFAGGLVLGAGIELAGTINSSVVEPIIKNGFFETIYGNVSFDERGQSVTELMVVQMQPDTLIYELVRPDKYANVDVVFPAPSWAERECTIDTSSCDGHGSCDSTGKCICDYGYYGFVNPESCDTYCTGTFHADTGACTRSTTYYIGFISDFQYPEYSEYIAHAQLAVQLVNNKTDGWFDDVTTDITLIINTNNSKCTQEGGYAATSGLNNWALEKSTSSLAGLIGGYCSAASKSASIFGNTIYLPQISYASTSVDLSNKDNYHYFARTCPSDDAQGPALVNTLTDLEIVPFISIVYTTDSYATSLANSFANSYITAGNTVLLQYAYDSMLATDETYVDIVNLLAASGAPAILLVVYQDQANAIFAAAMNHPVMSSDQVVWIGVDAWTNIPEIGSNVPYGTIGLGPYKPDGNITAEYLSVWNDADPTQYPDTDGDRSTVASYALQTADAVFAMAMALQKSLDDNTGLVGDTLKQYVYTVLTRDISFDGVSGPIDFASTGDLVSTYYSFSNYQGADDGSWEDAGVVAVSSTDLDYAQIVWPDGTTGKTDSYSDQLLPYCPAGEEPVLSSNGVGTSVYVCSPCAVGKYKPYEGTESCDTCPEGADCNDVGISIPCVLKNFWRDQPKTDEDLGNFKKYKIYSCDIDKVCEGGCMLNASCHKDRRQNSVMCGQCRKGHFLTDGQCYLCSDNAGSNTSRILLLLLAGMFPVALLSAMVVVLVYNIGSTRSFADKRGESFASNKDVHDTSIERNGKRRTILEKASRSVSKSIISPAIAMLTHHENQRKVKKVIKGSGMTAKITVSFLQVMTGSFFILDINWPNYLAAFFNTIRINPFRKIHESLSCGGDTEHQMHPVYLGVLFAALMPIFFIIVLAICALGAWQMYLYTRKIELPRREYARQWNRLRDISVKIYLWFCLLSYPPLSQRLLAFFNCRDLGTTGSFLRDDYSISCESIEYSRYFYIALFGVALIPIGIPVLFCLVIHNRFHPLLRNPSLLLHDNFAVEWRYYEVYDLIRKLLLTSVVVYISSPDTSSQCLYLLLVDLTALVLLAYSRPYANSKDDFLSSSLVAVECISFIVALIVISGIAEVENYNLSALYAFLFILILFSLACFVPCTLAMKFRAVRSRVHFCFQRIFSAGAGYGLTLPDLTRVVDSRARLQHEVDDMRNTLSDIRLSIMDPGEFNDIYKDLHGDQYDSDELVDRYESEDNIPPMGMIPKFQRDSKRSSNGELNPMQSPALNPSLQRSGKESPRDSEVECASDIEASMGRGAVAMTIISRSSRDSRNSGVDGKSNAPPVPSSSEPPVSRARSPSAPSYPPPPVPTSPTNTIKKKGATEKNEKIDSETYEM